MYIEELTGAYARAHGQAQYALRHITILVDAHQDVYAADLHPATVALFEEIRAKITDTIKVMGELTATSAPEDAPESPHAMCEASHTSEGGTPLSCMRSPEHVHSKDPGRRMHCDLSEDISWV